ncbi:MAG: hypothetical protein ABSA45_11715 [Verrucomicrobiota bacterium]|jgi:hypothetical protein
MKIHKWTQINTKVENEIVPVVVLVLVIERGFSRTRTRTKDEEDFHLFHLFHSLTLEAREAKLASVKDDCQHRQQTNRRAEFPRR